MSLADGNQSEHRHPLAEGFCGGSILCPAAVALFLNVRRWLPCHGCLTARQRDARSFDEKDVLSISRMGHVVGQTLECFEDAFDDREALAYGEMIINREQFCKALS